MSEKPDWEDHWEYEGYKVRVLALTVEDGLAVGWFIVPPDSEDGKGNRGLMHGPPGSKKEEVIAVVKSITSIVIDKHREAKE